MIYLAALNDFYETPLYVTDSAVDMARFLGTTTDSLYTRISRLRSGEIRRKKGQKQVLVYSFPDDGSEEDRA